MAKKSKFRDLEYDRITPQIESQCHGVATGQPPEPPLEHPLDHPWNRPSATPGAAPRPPLELPLEPSLDVTKVRKMLMLRSLILTDFAHLRSSEAFSTGRKGI